ncbi:MAG TPA: PQQ-binding-like beta-propeller repeat protein, partial [Micromonosporaceae bacterium]|nr:PQQ-binding-like beta-propeller repeat protein [Micromonosporaceae bacterium]
DHLGRLLARSVPHAWHRIAQPQAPTDRRDRRRFWDGVRAAKEMLSRTARAPVAVPGVDQAVHLTREELEQLVAPLVRRGVYETAAVVAACRLAPEQLAGLFLVGGSSRVPLVARLLHAELGVAPTVLEQPELPVAEGAVAELGRVPGPGPSAAAAVPSAVAAAVPAAPPVSPPGTLDPVPTSPAPTSPAAAPPHWRGGAPRPGAAPRPWYRRTVAWVSVATALVVLAGAGVAWFVLRDRYPEAKFQSVEEYLPVPMGEGASTSSGAFTAMLGDRAYLAWQRDDTLQVVAVDLARRTELWRKDVPGTSEKWVGITALPAGLVVQADDYSSSEPRTMYVLHPDSGDLRWKRDFHGDDSWLYTRDAVVLAEEQGARLVGLDPASGDERWTHPYPKDEYGNGGVAVVRVTSPEALAEPAGFTGQTPGADPRERRIVLVGTDRTVRVYDARTGAPLRTRDNVGDPDDTYLAHGDQLYVATKDAGYRIDAYDLGNLGEPRAIYTVPDHRRRLLGLAPCGADRVCALDQVGSDDESTELAAIGTEGGGQVRRQKAPAGERVVAVGDRALVASRGSAAVVRIFDPAAGELTAREGAGVRVNAGSVLIFADQPATYPQDVNLTGLGAQTGTRTELGVLKDVRSAACAWSESLIACPQEKTFTIWRFAQS